MSGWLMLGWIFAAALAIWWAAKIKEDANG